MTQAKDASFEISMEPYIYEAIVCARFAGEFPRETELALKECEVGSGDSGDSSGVTEMINLEPMIDLGRHIVTVRVMARHANPSLHILRTVRTSKIRRVSAATLHSTLTVHGDAAGVPATLTLPELRGTRRNLFCDKSVLFILRLEVQSTLQSESSFAICDKGYILDDIYRPC